MLADTHNDSFISWFSAAISVEHTKMHTHTQTKKNRMLMPPQQRIKLFN